MGVNGKKINKKEFTGHDLLIKRDVYEEMITYCSELLPYEACGLLSGIKDRFTTLWKIKNETKRFNRFTMSSESIKTTVKEMEKIGEVLSGIFHSHPSSPALPSTHDIRNNSYPELPYLIVSFHKGRTEVRCFKMIDKKVFPINIKIID
ncbi:Mov34/MPN/PAD-1 family protein [Cytobacillus oceanisediminis]|uniref:Proteasome lid subunit RPN8/RPN11 n=1 Tax=Cytobacillus oceanisediminis TaxID=665099 RepID=A0A562JA98_9BACI|nr:M67 family metallopeptidase [Cytobacillus oceanisediminis]TWH80099.1 proteasome lid subunit RPN8/RPN11 [Cytobacillus oceanisediminis]